MSFKQKVQDVVLLIQNDRKAQVFALLGILAIAFLVFNEPKRPVGPRIQKEEERGVGSLAQGEFYDDLKRTVITRLDETDNALKFITEEQKQQSKRIEENEIRTAEIFSTLIEKMSAQNAAIGQASGPDGFPTNSIPTFPDEQSDQLQTFGDPTDEGVVAPPPDITVENRDTIISTADFVRVKLLAGVNAPTDGTPYPVLFKLVGDVEGPDGSALPLGEARLLAAAQGSLTDSRALFRLTSLSMRFPNGERVEVDVDGWIVGEDGIRGMAGIPIDPLGKALAGAGTIGLVNGIGKGLSAANTSTVVGSTGTVVQTVNGDLLMNALGHGLSEPSKVWTDTIKDRLDQLVPQIQVFSGREATAVFSKPVKIPKLYELLNTGEYDIYSPLD
ncbi:MAG: TraB/VirB10 family protein [Bdellovibrionales bacterium]|nr:TraB/VirB10 family protein [Bdellovibrionales bacterium]